MAAVNNVPSEIQDSIRDILGQKVKFYIKRMIKQEIRPEKFEKRVIGLTGCRFFIFAAKTPSKIEQNFSFLEIQAIESKKPNQFTLTVDGKTLSFVTIESETEEVDHIITQIGTSLKNVFPAFPLERLIKKIEVQPPQRTKTMNDMIKGIEGKEVGPCGGFSMMYACMCDYHNLQYREEVAWDVDTIYLSQDSRELCLHDFDHLSSKDLVPIIAALEHNTWFTKLNANNVKLSFEAQSETLKVMKKNAILEELCLSNTGISVDFVTKLATALLSNSCTQLNRVDLSRNTLDDKAVIHFLGSLGNLSKGLVHFDISSTKIMGKGLNKVAETLSQNPHISLNLQTLNLSENGTKGEDLQHLYNFLAKSNTITRLDLSGTDCALEQLCGALLRGSCATLTHLRLARNVFSHKKSKEVTVQGTWKTFFSSVYGLEELDLSGCRIPSEALKELLLGIASNINIKALRLNLSNNDLQSQGAQVLGSSIGNVTCITSLDVSNNGFDQSLISLLDWIKNNKSIRHLAIGQNFDHIKPKNIPMVMESIVNLIQDEETCIESFSLADSKLKNHLADVINALGSNMTLTEIDISGNSVGDLGARMLSKALQINNKLRTIMWDKNNTTALGFEDIAEALQKNFTLKKMPTPIIDASSALQKHQERTGTALQKIESLLQRNHSPQKYSSDQAYRLQQGFLISSTQQMVDRLVVQVQDTINALSMGSADGYKADIEKANSIIKDADNSKQLLPSLQDIAMKSLGSGNPIEVKLNGIASDLKEVLQKHMKNTVEDMVKCTSSRCETVTSEKNFKNELVGGCSDRSALPKDFTKHLLDGVETDIFNKLSELNLAVAAHISDSVIDTVIESLTSSHKDLTNHLKKKRSHDTKSLGEDSKIENEQESPQEKADKEENEKPMMRVTVQDDSPVATPNLTNKRKSVHARKMRPPTVIVDVDTDLKKIAELPPPQEKLELDSLSDLPSTTTTKLNHISKSRPRGPQRRRPTTRQAEQVGDSGLKADEGLDSFFEARMTNTTTTNNNNKPATTPATTDRKPSETSKKDLPVPPSKPLSEKPTTKKWSPFSKGKDKDKDKEKAEKPEKKGAFSIFGKKDAPKKADRSPSLKDEKQKPQPPAKEKKEEKVEEKIEKIEEKEEIKEEEVKVETTEAENNNDDDKGAPPAEEPEEVPAPRPKKPIGGMGMGFGLNIMSEMKAKRFSMAPDKRDLKEARKPTEALIPPPKRKASTENNTSDKPLPGIVKQGTLKSSATDGALKSSATDSALKSSATDSALKSSATDGALKSSITDSAIKSSATNDALEPSATKTEEQIADKNQEEPKEAPTDSEKVSSDDGNSDKEKPQVEAESSKSEDKPDIGKEKPAEESESGNSKKKSDETPAEPEIEKSGNQLNVNETVKLRDKSPTGKKTEDSTEEKATTEVTDTKEKSEGQKARHSILQTVHANQKPQPAPRKPNLRNPSETSEPSPRTSVSSRSSTTSDASAIRNNVSLKQKSSPPVVRPKPPPKSKKPISLRKSEIEALNADGATTDNAQKQESGVVVDSATLRLSVGDKIKRLSLNADSTPAQTKAKTSSLPRNTEPSADQSENGNTNKNRLSTSSNDKSVNSSGKDTNTKEVTAEQNAASNGSSEKSEGEKEVSETDSAQSSKKPDENETDDSSSKKEIIDSVGDFEVVMV